MAYGKLLEKSLKLGKISELIEKLRMPSGNIRCNFLVAIIMKTANGMHPELSGRYPF